MIRPILSASLGIPADILSRVFDPFFTTKEIGYGSGLGLSQVHGFAQQAGGKVELTSEVGRGTTVRLYLLARRHAVTEPAREARRAAEGPHTHRVKGTILIVEDDVDIADLVATGLQRCGFTVKLAYRAAAALELLHSGQAVDLVFSDVVMPDGMSGIELADLLRNQYPAVPVLLATGYSEALSNADARGLQIISKPYRARDLCNTVTELIEHKLYQVP